MSFNNLDNLYRQVIMDHYKNPRNKGSLEEGSLTVEMNNPTCGDRIHLTMKVEDGKVADAKFDGEGCSISMASASMMTQTVIGQEAETALKLSQIFSDMVQGKDFDDDVALTWVTLKHFKAFQNFRRALDVQHLRGKQWKKV